MTRGVRVPVGGKAHGQAVADAEYIREHVDRLLAAGDYAALAALRGALVTPAVTRVCGNGRCGNPVTSPRPEARYCSGRCRTAVCRARRARAASAGARRRSGLVIRDLGKLHGPAGGTVELPLSVFWSLPDRRFNLDDPDARRGLYELVLQQSRRAEDLAAFLDRDTLIALWPRLRLPAAVRDSWEERHPVLRSAAAVT